jgi:glutamate-1-semialdehyde 2,1-aminomutase
VRAFKSVGGGPIVFDKVKDAYCFDVDGNKYVDYVGSWGPAICGHSNDQVNAALKAQIDKGSSFGAPCELENVLGQMVIDRVPSVEMVRFCNSGTEACLSVLRVMRAYTGRDKIIKFEGCYHGHADPFLVQAGSGRRHARPPRLARRAQGGDQHHALRALQRPRGGEEDLRGEQG